MCTLRSHERPPILPAPKRFRLSHATLVDLLFYSPRHGGFMWRVDRGRTAKAGSKAGTLRKDGSVVIGINGRIYAANRLAWLYVLGEWPKGRLTTYNKNPADLRWNNIVQEDEVASTTRRAAYQRYRYRLAKAIANGESVASVPRPEILMTDRRRLRRPTEDTSALDARLDAAQREFEQRYK